MLYWNAETEAADYVENAYVEWWHVDSYTGQILGGADGRTDSYGLVLNVGCPESPSYYIEGYIDLFDDISSVSTETPFVITECGNSIYHEVWLTHDDNYVLYSRLSAVGTGSRTHFQRQRASVTAEIWTGTSYYDVSMDRLRISSAGVYGEWGWFTAAHEYGHAFQYKALSGWTELGSGCGSHHFSSYEDARCAFVEGFADYHAVASLKLYPWALPYWTSYFESNSAYPNEGGGDGAHSEGPVAAFLLDLTDPSNEPHDGVSYPGSYLADVIKTCQALHGFWQKRRNIAEVVYCLEGGIDPFVRDHPLYFSAIDDPSTVMESATEPASWSQSAIRQLWRHNLYGGQ